jgi:hypothetical protein
MDAVARIRRNHRMNGTLPVGVLFNEHKPNWRCA